MKNQWVEITSCSDERKKFLCVLTGAIKYEEYYIGDNNRQEPDPEILRALGHNLK